MCSKCIQILTFYLYTFFVFCSIILITNSALYVLYFIQGDEYDNSSTICFGG